jgi:lipid II:glycine glycyltransferase (peptidoglycan interpeptide bridge formation enzyme)
LVLVHGGHPLQLWGWGEVKAAEPQWTAHRLWADGLGGAQVLVRKLPAPFGRLAYVPRGPVPAAAGCGRDLWAALAAWAKRQGVIELKLEPAAVEGPVPPPGWKESPNPILMNRTVALDLSLGEAALLAAMAKKTRQYIRKSGGEGLAIRRVTDEAGVRACLAVYRDTAQRAGFALHAEHYYLAVAEHLAEHSWLYAAELEGAVLAFLWNAVTPGVAFELYGGVTDRGQELRANFALKWRAIQDAIAAGVAVYDLNGLVSDGVSNFKLGFAGGAVTELPPTLDLPLSPLYAAWEGLLPQAKKAARAVRGGRRPS